MEMEMAVETRMPERVGSDPGNQSELLLLLLLVADSDQHSSEADQSRAGGAAQEPDSALLRAGSSGYVQGWPVDAGRGTACIDVAVLQQVNAGTRERQLRGLRESIPHNMKLQQLKKAERQIVKEMAAHKTAYRGLSKELYQMLSWYALLISAIYTGVAQTSVLTCRLWWGPFSITALVAVAICRCLTERLRSIGHHKKNAAISQTRQNAIYDMIDEMLQHGAACDLNNLQPHHNQESPGLAVHSGSWYCLKLFSFSPLAVMTSLFFIGICAITTTSFYFMLCVPGCICPSLS